MKKKLLIAAIIVIMIGVLIFILFRVKQATTNSSRRDGDIHFSVTEEDVGPSGDQGLSDASSEATTRIIQEKNEIDVSGITADTNEPVSEEVEPVSTIILSEAIRVDEGEIGDFYSNEEFQGVIPVDIRSFSADDIPDKYDSRDVSGKRYITEVEDQGYTYLCWSYAALAAVESDLLSHHSNMDYRDIDLSEKHLAYYNMHRTEGSLGGLIDDDYRELVNADNEKNAWIFDYDTNYVAMGGVTNFCLSLLTSWKGPVAESGDDSFSSIYGESFLFKDNAQAPSDAYNSDYHVQAVNEIMASEANRNMVKQMIMEHGCVSASVNADNKYWRDHNGTLYSSFGGEPVPTANHEVIICGWDDDYSASNFVTKPKADGAWLCRNSWGKTSGKGGYFYLSYYDETTCDNIVAAYSTASKGEKNWYDNNYQLCGFIDNVVSALDDSQNYVTAYTNSGNPYAVMYEAASDEILKAVGFMNIDTYQQYEIKVYVNPETTSEDLIEFKDLDEPASATKASVISGGYHTYELSKPVTLNAGDRFIVLVDPVSSGRLVYEHADTYTGTANYDEWNNLTGNVYNNYEASGQSYYIANDGTGMMRQTDKDFFVKAYTNNR